MVLISEAAQLKAKLMLKGRCRPEKMVRRKMPDGSGMLASVPQRRQGGRGADADELDEFLEVLEEKGRKILPGPEEAQHSSLEFHQKNSSGGIVWSKTQHRSALFHPPIKIFLVGEAQRRSKHLLLVVAMAAPIKNRESPRRGHEGSGGVFYQKWGGFL
jgi:hypothetical protein